MATKWGIVSAGKISHDFVTAVRSIPEEGEHEIVAIAARNVESASAFAKLHNIPKSYGSYEELAQDPEIEVVYVGTINTQHLPVCQMMLNHGKHLLVEKPLCMNVRETRKLISLAKEKKLFLMEAIWSRFFPSYQMMSEELKKKTIGDPKQVIVTFGVPIDSVDRVRAKELGGGATLDIGVYALNIISMAFNGDRPVKISAVGSTNKEGVDNSVAASLLYSDNRLASLMITTDRKLACEAEIYGTKGKMKLPYPFWCSTKLIVNDQVHEYDLPPTILPCNYDNSSGLRYEANEVRKCLKEGKLESSVMTLEDSDVLATLMEGVRSQVGVVYFQDQDD